MAKSLRVKKGDTVVVLAGSEKGAKGKVIRSLPDKGRVVVERVSMVKKHQKPTAQNPAGGIVEKEAAIDVSNVRLVCPKCSESIRARRHQLDDGTSMRRCPKCDEAFE